MERSFNSSYSISSGPMDSSSEQMLSPVIKSTSKKHDEFICEPLADKDVTSVPGIGEVTGSKLTKLGFEKAYMLLGQFLLLKKDSEAFTEWLMEEFGSTKKNANNCAYALNEWSKAFI
ncbi:hypothetical protein ACOME3_001081 [Neoechinorhynchus agilis]